MRYARCRMLFGRDYARIEKASVLLLGVGGVGGYCLDCLYRSGVGRITIVDFDTFEESNRNRQIGSDKVGAVKVWHLQRLYPGIEAIEAKVTRAWCERFDFSPYDLVIDAIDDIRAKVALAHHAGEKLISSMGGAKRIDPTQIATASVWKSHSDPLARTFRYELKKSGFGGDFPVVYSTEPPRCKELGSFVGVTGAFGFALCSLAVRRMLEPS